MLACFIAIGCAVPVWPTDSPHDPDVHATPSPNPWLDSAEIDRAMEFRRASGLRADELWARRVAMDPASEIGVEAFSIPLLPSEVEGLERRARISDEAMPVIEAYGEAEPTWAGAYVERQTGAMIALFTDDAVRHQLALGRLLHPEASVIVVEASWTLAELRRLQKAIAADAGWLEEHGHKLLGVGVSISSNHTFVDVSSADPRIGEILAQRYDGAGRLAVTTDGTGVRLWPTGTLTGLVLDKNGDPVGDLLVELVPDIPGAGPASDIGYATGPTGRFAFRDVTAVRYIVHVVAESDPGQVLGEAEAIVRAGKTTEVTITVER